MFRNCPDSLNFSRTAAKKIDYHAKRSDDSSYGTHMVLAALSSQLDSGNTEGQEQVIDSLETSDKANLRTS